MYESLIQNIKDLVPLNDADRKLVEDAFNPVRLKKKEFLLKQGDYSNHMRFIADGCLKVFDVDDNGNEHILQFGIKGWWVNDLYAYLTEQPANYHIQAITDSVVLQVHRTQLNKLYDEVHMIDRFFRIKTQNGYVALQERTIHSMSDIIEATMGHVAFVDQPDLQAYRDSDHEAREYAAGLVKKSQLAS